jgi:O-antigen/teichoic acid export membrane protein
MSLLTNNLYRAAISKALHSLAIRVAGVGLTFVAYVLLARVMPVDEYGQFIYAVNFIAILALIAQAGFQTSVQRFFHEYAKQPHYRAGFIITSFWLPLLLSLSFLLLALLVTRLWDLPEIIGRTLPYIVVGSLFFTLTYVAQQSLKASKRIVFSQIFEQIGLPLTLIALAASFLWVWPQPLSFSWAARSYISVFLLLSFVAWGLFFRSSYPKRVSPAYHLKLWCASSVSMGVISLIGALMTRLDVLIIGVFLTSTDVAEYGVAARIAALLAFVYAALNNAVTPLLSEHYHAGNPEKMYDILRKLSRISLTLNLFGFGVLVLLHQYILGLFGAQYLSAGDLLLILGFAQAVNIASGPLGSVLMLMNHQRAYLYFNTLFGIVFAGLLWMVIPLYGVVAAALVTACIGVVMSICLVVLVYRKTGFWAI